MSTQTVQKGTRVRFTAGRLGCLADPEGIGFHHYIVGEGEEGTYYGVHASPSLADRDWHLIEIEHDGLKLYVPVHSRQFEVVA